MEKFAYGAFGAVLPDIILFYSKRFSAPFLNFDYFEYAVVTLVYMAAAGIVARIYPYKGTPTPWKAAVVGITLPIIISTVTATADRVTSSSGSFLEVRGPQPVTTTTTPPVKIPGNIIDLMSAF